MPQQNKSLADTKKEIAQHQALLEQVHAARQEVRGFIDAVTVMLKGLAADPEYAGKLFHVDLRGTLATKDDWANELHPGNAGFSKLAGKIDDALQANI